MMDKVGRGPGHDMLLEIGRRATDDPPHRPDPNGAEARIRQMPDPDGDIDAFLDDIDQPVDEQAAPGHRGKAIQIVEQDR